MKPATHETLRKKLVQRARDAGGYTKLGAQIGLSGTYLARVGQGKQGVSDGIAAALGYERRVVFVRLRAPAAAAE